MIYVLFAKMDQVFSKENKILKKILENWKKILEIREFCQSGKVGTLYLEGEELGYLGGMGSGRGREYPSPASPRPPPRVEATAAVGTYPTGILWNVQMCGILF